jgi:hypothetical protein
MARHHARHEREPGQRHTLRACGRRQRGQRPGSLDRVPAHDDAPAFVHGRAVVHARRSSRRAGGGRLAGGGAWARPTSGTARAARANDRDGIGALVRLDRGATG